ncbi:hypothetical protein TWF281_000946 [Arthrobotrys megalospora]
MLAKITLITFLALTGAANAQSPTIGNLCYRDVIIESQADLILLHTNRCDNLRSLEIRSGVTAGTVNITSVKTIRYGLNVTGTGLENFFLPNLDTVGYPGIEFASNRDLVNIDMRSLRYINGKLHIANNPNVKRITFPKLSTVYGNVDISGGFDTAEFSSPIEVSGSFTIRTTKEFDCTNLDNLPENWTVRGEVDCQGSDKTALTLSAASSRTGLTKTHLAIVISIAIGVTAIIGIVAYWFIRRRRKRKHELLEHDPTNGVAELSDHKGPTHQTPNVYPIELDATDPPPEKAPEFELEAKEPVVAINYPPGVKPAPARGLPITGSEHSAPRAESNRREVSELSGTLAGPPPLEHQISPRSQGMGETVSPSSATQNHSWEMSAIPTPSDQLSVSYQSENAQSTNLNTSPTGYQEHSEPKAPNLTVDTSLTPQPMAPASIISQPEHQTLPVLPNTNPARNPSNVEDDELQWLEEQEAMIRARKARLLQSQARSRNDTRNV